MSKPKTTYSNELHKDKTPFFYTDTKCVELLNPYSANVMKVYFNLCRNGRDKKKKQSLYKQREINGGNYNPDDHEITIFPQRDMEACNMHHNTAEKALKILWEIGAIDIVENNRHRKIMNVYRVYRWDKWTAVLNSRKQRTEAGIIGTAENEKWFSFLDEKK